MNLAELFGWKEDRDEWYEPDAWFVCESCCVFMQLKELEAGCPVCGETMMPLPLAELS